jgi:hypothetical protein
MPPIKPPRPATGLAGIAPSTAFPNASDERGINVALCLNKMNFYYKIVLSFYNLILNINLLWILASDSI